MLEEITRKIENSTLKTEEKQKALDYATTYSGGRVCYTAVEKYDSDSIYPEAIPLGSIELFRIINNDMSVEDFKRSRNIRSKLFSFYDTTAVGALEGIYEDLHRLSRGEFAVSDFVLKLDCPDYNECHPYRGFVGFSYNGANYHYAPNYDYFDVLVFAYINNFLRTQNTSDKRFIPYCYPTSLMGGDSMWIETTIFIDKQQFDLLNFYSFIPTQIIKWNICLWNPEDANLNVENGFIKDFDSVSRQQA